MIINATKAESMRLVKYGSVNSSRIKALARLTKKTVTVLGTARFGVVYNGPANFWVWGRSYYPSGHEFPCSYSGDPVHSPNWDEPAELATKLQRAAKAQSDRAIVVLTQ